MDGEPFVRDVGKVELDPLLGTFFGCHCYQNALWKKSIKLFVEENQT